MGMREGLFCALSEALGIVSVMSETTEHKSVDGRAVLTDTHLIFEYNLLGRTARKTKRSEIPLEKITAFEIIPGSITYLRVAADGWSATPNPAQSALAFALHPRKSHLEFVDALRSASGAQLEHIAVADAPASPALPSAKFGGYTLRHGMLSGQGKTIRIVEATAEATQGAPSQRSTLTRMGAGALIAGPIGFVVGAVARKNTSKCYVTIELPEGVVVIEGHSKEYPEAVAFASAVNRTARDVGATT